MADFRPIDAAAVAAQDGVAAGAVPMLQWIEVDNLVIDDSYQRAPHLKVVERIAKEFDWRKFSTVLVAPVEGGMFAVIDGQHRSHAAAACGIEKVPCQVTIMDRTEQAQAFAAINGVGTPVGTNALFKAAIAAGETWAVEVRDTCLEAGCRALTSIVGMADRKPGDIMAVGFLRSAIAARGRVDVAQALRIVRQARHLGTDVDTYNVGTLQPLVGAISSRPHVLRQAEQASISLDKIGVAERQNDARAFRAERLRAGLPTMGLKDLLESLIGDALDKAMSRVSP